MTLTSAFNRSTASLRISGVPIGPLGDGGGDELNRLLTADAAE